MSLQSIFVIVSTPDLTSRAKSRSWSCTKHALFFPNRNLILSISEGAISLQTHTIFISKDTISYIIWYVVFLYSMYTLSIILIVAPTSTQMYELAFSTMYIEDIVLLESCSRSRVTE